MLQRAKAYHAKLKSIARKTKIFYIFNQNSSFYRIFEELWRRTLFLLF